MRVCGCLGNEHVQSQSGGDEAPIAGSKHGGPNGGSDAGIVVAMVIAATRVVMGSKAIRLGTVMAVATLAMATIMPMHGDGGRGDMHATMAWDGAASKPTECWHQFVTRPACAN